MPLNERFFSHFLKKSSYALHLCVHLRSILNIIANTHLALCGCESVCIVCDECECNMTLYTDDNDITFLSEFVHGAVKYIVKDEHIIEEELF